MIFNQLRFLGSRVRVWRSGEHAERVIIFLHGSGITAFGMEKWLRSCVSWPPDDVAVILPSAPILTYDVDQQLRSVWHQRKDINIDSDYEDSDGISRISDGLAEMLEDITAKDKINKNNIIIGGFSMGGHMAIHSVYNHNLKVSKCFAISSFLINQSQVYKSIEESKENRCKVPLYLAHGDHDTIVPLSWTNVLLQRFQVNNINSSLTVYKGLGHEIRSDVLQDIFSWSIK